MDVQQGARCDEINERSYCSEGLVCHRCPSDTNGYKCVQCKSLFNVSHNELNFIFIVSLTGCRVVVKWY